MRYFWNSWQWRWHPRLGYGAIALAPIVGSFAYNSGFRLPFIGGCPSLYWIGIPCPAWGLTRSFMAIARGDLSTAIHYHLLGPLLFLGFLIAGIHLGLEWLTGRSIQAFYIRWVRSPQFQLGAFLVLCVYHGFRLYPMVLSGELHTAFMESPLGQSLL